MYLYEELLGLATRIKKVIENNPGKIAEINMGLLSQIDMERLKNWVEIIEKEIGNNDRKENVRLAKKAFGMWKDRDDLGEYEKEKDYAILGELMEEIK